MPKRSTTPVNEIHGGNIFWNTPYDEKIPVHNFVVFACTTTFAQSISFEELMGISNMADDEVSVFLIGTKGFKWEGKVILNGNKYAEYKSNRVNPQQAETITVALNPDGSGTSFSRPVFYATSQQSDINTMLSQVKKARLEMIFRGSDLNKSIYLFDNSVFIANISLSLDKKWVVCRCNKSERPFSNSNNHCFSQVNLMIKS